MPLLEKFAAKPFLPFLHDVFVSWSLLRPSDQMFLEVEKQVTIICCKVGNVRRMLEFIYILTHSLTYLLTYLLTYILTYLLHGAESILRS